MHKRNSALLFACLVALGGLFLGGCSSHKFKPARYSTFSDNPKITASKRVLICQPFDSIPREERKNYDSKFHPADYFHNMLRSELQSRNVGLSDVKPGKHSSYDEIASWLASSSDVSDDTVVLASNLIWFPDVTKFSCDIKTYDNKGNLLFAKRGLSFIRTGELSRDKPNLFDASHADNDPKQANNYHTYLQASRHAMKQIFDDPDFRKILQ